MITGGTRYSISARQPQVWEVSTYRLSCVHPNYEKELLMKVPYVTRVLSFALLAAIAATAASLANSPPAPARVNAAAASGSSPVHEQPLPLPRVGLGAATGADGRVYTIGGTGPEN